MSIYDRRRRIKDGKFEIKKDEEEFAIEFCAWGRNGAGAMRKGGTLLCGFTVAGITTLAQAQTPSQQAVIDATALRRIDVETHTPVRVITSEDLARMGVLGLGEVLQRLPFMSGPAANLNSNADGNGAVVADIGGLGSARCVVMLNGQRLPVNGYLGAPSVDLDAIPVASIDRIEIFLGGAAPTWGGDAIAGVINVISRADAQGVEARAATARSARGDGTTGKASLFGGKVFGNGYANVTIDYRNEEPIEAAARGFSAKTEALGCLHGAACIWPFGSSVTPAGVFVVPDGNELGLPAGRYTRDPSGGWRPFVATGPRNDTYSTQTDTFLRDSRTGGSVAVNGGYDFSAVTHTTFEVLAAKDRSRQQLSALPLATAFDGAAYAFGASIPRALVPSRVAADNFYNPFGLALSNVQRRLVELGPTKLANDSSMVLVSGGLTHVIGPWELAASFSWGMSEVTRRTSDVLLPDHLVNALGPSGPDASGAIRCGDRDPLTGVVSEPLPDCVPLDLFHGPGSISQSMLNYIAAPSEEQSRVTQTEVGLMARRELALGHGLSPARLAIGIEARRNDLTLTPVPLYADRRLDDYDLVSEIALPFDSIGQTGAASSLTVGGRLSYAEHRISGQVSAAPLFAALTWRLTPQWLVRARLTQVYHVASPGELSQIGSQRPLIVSNPCVTPTARSSPLCEIAASPVGFGSLTPTELMSSIIDLGNSRAERGYSSSAGVVWNSPTRRERFVGLDLTIVEIRNAIRAQGALELIRDCLERQWQSSCRPIVPVQGDGTFAIYSPVSNTGTDDSARLDLEMRDGGATGWGEWHAELLAGYLLQRRLLDSSGHTLANLRGTYDIVFNNTGIAYPVAQSQAHLQWKHGSWMADWTTQYIGSFTEMGDSYGLLLPAGNTSRRVGSTTYHDLALAWTARSLYTVRLGVDNVFDRSPPRVNNALQDNTDASAYRLEGRMFWLGVELAR